jgi:hypothetical protein
MSERAHTKGGWTIGPNIFRQPSLAFDMPAGTDMILVCVDTHQHVPIAIMLPHQFTVDRARELLTLHCAESLTVMPYRNATKIEVTAEALSKASGEVDHG